MLFGHASGRVSHPATRFPLACRRAAPAGRCIMIPAISAFVNKHLRGGSSSSVAGGTPGTTTAAAGANSSEAPSVVPAGLAGELPESNAGLCCPLYSKQPAWLRAERALGTIGKPAALLRPPLPPPVPLPCCRLHPCLAPAAQLRHLWRTSGGRAGALGGAWGAGGAQPGLPAHRPARAVAAVGAAAAGHAGHVPAEVRAGQHPDHASACCHNWVWAMSWALHFPPDGSRPDLGSSCLGIPTGGAEPENLSAGLPLTSLSCPHPSPLEQAAHLPVLPARLLLVRAPAAAAPGGSRRRQRRAAAGAGHFGAAGRP